MIYWADAYGYATPITDGWRVVNDQWEINPWSPGLWEANHWASLDNWTFPCPTEPPPTWTFYNPNRLYIYGNGNVSFYNSSWAYGMCSNLLTLYQMAWQDY